jgi:hypothetical protein
VPSLGEPVTRCILGSVKRFLAGLGMPTLWADAAGDGFEVTSAGFGFFPNGLGFRGGVTGGPVSPDVAPDTDGASAGGSIFVSFGCVGLASVRGRSA